MINLKKVFIAFTPWLIGAIILIISFAVVPKVGATVQNEDKKVCFCHNVNNNPHTICTSNKGLIKGHIKHVKNGEDYVGACKPTDTPEPTESPEPTTSPSSTPEATPSPSSSPTAQACGHGCVTDDDCRRYDPSYVCYKDNTCRHETNSEDPQCSPRDPQPESVMSVEELKQLPAGNK